MPSIPKYAPPTVTANIIRSGLTFNEELVILGFIILASNCCKTITTMPIIKACCQPPVSIVIIIAIATPNIAPKYGIKFEKPIKVPSKIEYLTPNILIAILVIIATTIPSNI